MSKESLDQAKEQIVDLKVKYLERLKEQVEEIEELILSLLGHSEPPSVLAKIKLSFHNIAGSSGSFGLSRLGAHCKQAELLCEELLLKSPIKITEEQVTRLMTCWEQATNLMYAEKDETTFHISLNGNNAFRELKKIWVIDDDVLLTHEYKRQFESFGFEVEVFNQLEAANQAAKSSHPDAILLDVIFDDGHLNASEELTHCTNLKSLDCPIIFMSAYNDFDSRVRAVKQNAKGYFLKPISIPHAVNYMRDLYEQMNLPKANVLIVDDDPYLASRIRIVLNAAGFNAHCLEDPQKIIEEIDRLNVKLVLMDLHMPYYNGIELAGVIRQHEKWLRLPIVFLSSETDLGLQAEALNQGAEEFLAKPVNDIQLINTVRAKIQRSRSLEDDVLEDNLTGLLKHSVIKDVTVREVMSSKRNKIPCTLILFDIDELDRVNNNHGFKAGNLVIKSLSNLLKQNLRKTDFIGRYGGEEFALVLSNCDLKTGKQIANKVINAFQSVKFEIDGNSFSCTLSGGLCCTDDFDGIDGDNALAIATTALNYAKKYGRNQLVNASDIMISNMY